MNFTEATEYTKNGCNITGKLVIVDYQEHWKSQKNYGKFGAGTIFDAVEDAEKELRQKYTVKRILLAIPEIVAEVE